MKAALNDSARKKADAKQAPITLNRPCCTIHPTHSGVGQLQKTIGNRVAQCLYNAGKLQTALKIGRPNDVYEQDADRVAEQVMRMPEPLVQKKCRCSSGGQPCTKCAEEKEMLNIQRKADTSAVSDSSVPDNFMSSLGVGQPLDKTTRDYFEPRFGMDFSRIRVHTGSKAEDSASSINAHAYTLGNNVVFGRGQYQPQTIRGKRLLAHELTHTMQQGGVVGRRIQLARIHFYDYTDNFARRGGYAAEYCQDYSYVTGRCSANIPGNDHAAIDAISQVPGWISTFKSRGLTINEVIFHTHGAPGYVHLPKGGLTASNVSSISSIAGSLASDALIDFKGCNVAEGATGQTFLLAVADNLLNVNGGKAKGTDSVTFSVPGIGQRRPIWSSRPTVCIVPGGRASVC